MINLLQEALGVQFARLLLLAIPIACVAWTVTHEEIFAEPRNYCVKCSKESKQFIKRKFFYVFTCEYCFSHYVTLLFLFLTHFKMLMTGWMGYVIAEFSLVWIANFYMSVFDLLRKGIKKERVEVEVAEKELREDN